MAHIIRSARVDDASRHLPSSFSGKPTMAQGKQPASGPATRIADRVIPDEHQSIDNGIKNDAHQSELIHGLRQQLTVAEKKAEIAQTALSELRANIEAEYEQARKSGSQEGYQKAEQQLHDEYAELKWGIQEVIKKLTGEYERKLQDMESDMLEIIFATLAKVITDTVQDAAYIKSCVQQVTAQFQKQRLLKVYLAPRDYEWLQQQGALVLEKFYVGEVSFVPDERVQYGGCIVESENGGCDARLEIQLKMVKDILLSTYRQQKEL